MQRGIIRLLFLLIISSIGIVANAQDTACPAQGYLPPRLAVGEWAYVVSGTSNNLRAEPTIHAERVGRIPSGDVFRVVDGPRCADGYVWWQVRYDDITAWTAEGDALTSDYWLEGIADSAPASSEANSVSAAEPAGCEKPPEIYDRIEIGFGILNLRTVAMLDHAQELFSAAGGTLHFRDGIMQGGYNPGGVAASFGTHDGGGAVDISVRNPANYDVMTDEIPLMLHALRTAGFAAWLRSPDELYPGSPIHIHAIAIGDAELSEAARGQIDGTFGYLRGYNGLPQDSGLPLPDTSGEMVVCNWMIAMGFHDLRNPLQ